LKGSEGSNLRVRGPVQGRLFLVQAVVPIAPLKAGGTAVDTAVIRAAARKRV
jgi:hypothetical protein